MHLRTHVRAEHRGRYTHGDSEYVDGMMEHEDTVGSLLKALDDLVSPTIRSSSIQAVGVSAPT